MLNKVIRLGEGPLSAVASKEGSWVKTAKLPGDESATLDSNHLKKGIIILLNK